LIGEKSGHRSEIHECGVAKPDQVTELIEIARSKRHLQDGTLATDRAEALSN
jgi:hypothetical protein